ncbi:carboxylate-amine ligase [Dactylosporangium sp. CS-047395]|uniref:carboxylate-amine ligase n=1 Tax=Dactylosporangium sp. CS-047395 TaxID=3239936 RepID=UPI003D9364E1
MRPDPPTVGVEEEFLLLDPPTWRNVPAADELRVALPESLRERDHAQFRSSKVEMVTPVCATLAELSDRLAENRTAAAAAARRCGARLVAVGATPVAEPDLTEVDTPRFHAIVEQYGPIAQDPALCGCHVHVGVPSRELALEVCNHLRPWLPVIQAMGVNSPWYAGTDSRHASWRGIALERWPNLGPWPLLDSPEDYEQAVDELVGTGVMLDATMGLWWARPSTRYPTVEIRVGDVSPTADDAVLVAGLVRALVGTAVGDIAAGRPALRMPEQLLRAAHWNASHQGLGGTLTDLWERCARPAWELVDRLHETVAPALERHGDAALVAAGLDRLRTLGTGADRQRRAGDLPRALANLADQTAG